MIPRDSRHPAVRHVEVCVRDVEEPDLGKRETNRSELSEPKRCGVSDLQADAFREIEQRVNLEDYVDETIAEVYIDIEAWEYAIEYRVDVPLKQRLRRLLTGGVR